jgi:hypothetical protein
LCRKRSAVETFDSQRLELAEGISPRGLTRHCTDKAGNNYSVPLHICGFDVLLLKVFSRLSRRMPTPKSCAAGAGCVTTVERCAGAAAKL